MKTAFKIVGVSSITLGLFATALPASADVSTHTWQMPEITEVGGSYVDNWEGVDENDEYYGGGFVNTQQTKPEFGVEVTDDALTDGRMIIRDAKTHKALCEAATAHPANEHIYLCTPTSDLPFGDSTIQAVIVKGGVETTSYTIDMNIDPADPTIVMDSYDEATKTGHFSGTGTAGADLQLAAGDYRSPVTKVAESGTWTAEIPDFYRGHLVHVTTSFGHAETTATYFVNDPNPLAPPVVSKIAYKGTTAFVTFDAPSQYSIGVVDGMGRLVASGISLNGKATLTIATGKNEAHYTVASGLNGRQVESELTLHEGVGSVQPDAVDVQNIVSEPGKAQVSITGEAGAISRVLDADGTVVATKLISAKGSTTLTVPLRESAAGSDSTFTIDQSTVTARSTSVPITIPAS